MSGLFPITPSRQRNMCRFVCHVKILHKDLHLIPVVGTDLRHHCAKECTYALTLLYLPVLTLAPACLSLKLTIVASVELHIVWGQEVA